MSRARELARSARIRFGRIAHGTAYRAGLYRPPGALVKLFVHPDEWALQWMAQQISAALNRQHSDLSEVVYRPIHAFERPIHFGSRYLWQRYGWRFSKSNRFVITSLHGRLSDGGDLTSGIRHLIGTLANVTKVITTSTALERRHLEWGVPREKLVVVPLGVDLGRFVPPLEAGRRTARKRLSIPRGSLCIGSFQKDGVGWEEGTEPKLVKGPDVFVEALALLRSQFPIFVLLTGPARGYVTSRLRHLSVPHRHVHLSNFYDIVSCYHALDLYLISARDEGGPLALLESMATGVPVVSTEVGMAVDTIRHGENGILVPIEDVDALASAAGELLANPERRLRIAAAARDTVLDYDWQNTARRLYEEVYSPILRDLDLLHTPATPRGEVEATDSDR